MLRVSLIFEAQLRHGSIKLGETGLGLSEDSADHHEICCLMTADPIYNISPLSESNSEGDTKIFMVAQRDALVKLTEEEIA
jgi:hypothetical protein